jgi:Flp pilus assembly pilin Flp
LLGEEEQKIQPRTRSWRIHMKTLLTRFVTEEQGQDLIEYALLAGFISLAAVAAISSISDGLADIYKDTEIKVKEAADKQ